MGYGGDQPLAAGSASVAPRHVGGGAGLINEHQLTGIERRLAALPAGTSGASVIARRLYLRLFLWRSNNRHTVDKLTLILRSASPVRSSSRVMSGAVANLAKIHSP